MARSAERATISRDKEPCDGRPRGHWQGETAASPLSGGRKRSLSVRVSRFRRSIRASVGEPDGVPGELAVVGDGIDFDVAVVVRSISAMGSGHAGVGGGRGIVASLMMDQPAGEP